MTHIFEIYTKNEWESVSEAARAIKDRGHIAVYLYDGVSVDEFHPKAYADIVVHMVRYCDPETFLPKRYPKVIKNRFGIEKGELPKSNLVFHYENGVSRIYDHSKRWGFDVETLQNVIKDKLNDTN